LESLWKKGKKSVGELGVEKATTFLPSLEKSVSRGVQVPTRQGIQSVEL